MNDSIFILENRLNELNNILLDFEKKRVWNSEVYNLYKEKRAVQRALSLAKNQETAILIDYRYPWDTGAPLPHVLSDGYKTFLIYYIGENAPIWKANLTEITNLDTGHEDLTALVEFTHCHNYKFGGINDEVINGHPLFEHGLEAYEAHIIVNSKWLAEEEKFNSVHSNYSHASWENFHHYLFTFHDEIFECIASGFKVNVFKGRIESVFHEATKRLFEQKK